MKSIEILIIFLIIVFIICPLSYYLIKKNEIFESFTNLYPGKWPESDTEGLLSITPGKFARGFYEWNKPFPPKPPKTMSGLNYARQALSYPMYSAKSCTTNNLEFWPLPINGTCSFPELCGNFYKPLDCKSQKEACNPMSIKGKPIEVFPNCEQGPRVGFYCSKKK